MSRRRDKGESGHYSRHCKRWLNTMPESDKHIWVHVGDDDMAKSARFTKRQARAIARALLAWADNETERSNT